jgi:AcrR family transcriptional regulator
MGVQERREREREARKSAVLDAARGLFLERGFTGTTTKQIAEKCELSEATVFFYFRSKNEIFTSLLFEGIEFWAQGLEKVAAQDLPPREKLARVWDFFGQVYIEHPEYSQLTAFLARPMATADVSDEVRDEIIRRSGGNFQQLAAILEDILGDGQGRIVADLLWSTYMGLTLLKESRVNLGAPVHPTRKEMDRVFELLTRGLLPD